jgi:PAS domain S-box-containing protein
MASLGEHLATIRYAFEDVAQPVLVLGADKQVLYANPAARSRGAQGNDLDKESALALALLPVLERGEPAHVEWGEGGPAGVRCWYACTVSPLRREGHIEAWLCISTEVTDLKRTEERLRRSEQLMVDTQGVAHLGTWEWDIREPHAFWSAELYRIYGLTPEAYTPSYEAYLTMVHPDDRQRVMDATNRVFHEHVPYSHDERIFRPDRSLRYLHTWAYPILDDEGNLVRLVGVCQDITEQKQAEEQVGQMNADLERRVAERTRQLEASLRDLEAFNAMVSHDLRSPLFTIETASTTMSRRDPGSPEAQRSYARLRRAISQMTTLIDDLVAFARIGNAPLQRTAVDLSAMAHELVGDLRQSSPARAVSVSIESGIFCVADRELMRVALQNLLANAWKYTSRVEQPLIELATTAIDGRTVLLVRDNGAGFDMKDAHRLFAPFQRLHSESEFAGTGLGLASVHRILERHACRVWAESAPDRGATFFVDLPSVGTKEGAGNRRVAPDSVITSDQSAPDLAQHSFLSQLALPQASSSPDLATRLE